jgi:ABC-type transport system involved in multi-copper enzyme maturation permease subunit
MINGYDIKTLFLFFFKVGIRAKRARLFFIVSMIPAVIFIIVRIVALLNPGKSYPFPALFLQFGGVFYFQMFIQFLWLFYGSSVLTDEVDNKTLVYLTTSPASKASILASKFMAHTLISVVIITSGLLLSFVISYFSNLLKAVYLGRLGIFLGAALLAALAYSSLFTLLGTLMKKSILVGLFFVFGWEAVAQFLPGATQKLTIIHYVKSLLPAGISSGSRSLLFINLQPSSSTKAIITLLFLTVLFLTFSIFIFYKKEFTLSDQG